MMPVLDVVRSNLVCGTPGDGDRIGAEETSR